MENMVNTGSLTTLKSGEVLAVNARKVANGKISIEIGEILTESSNSGTNLIKMANKGDDRFTGGGARRAWLTGTPEGLSEMFGIDFNTLEYSVNDRGHEISALNILSPTISIETPIGVEQHAICVQVTETTTPNEWQALNFETAAKRRGANGAICQHQGKAIFANTDVALVSQRTNTFLNMDVAVQVAGIGSVSSDTGEIFS